MKNKTDAEKALEYFDMFIVDLEHLAECPISEYFNNCPDVDLVMLKIRDMLTKDQKLNTSEKHVNGTNIRVMEALENLFAIVENTTGVTGWHLNGDVATWGELDGLNELQTIRDFIQSKQETPNMDKPYTQRMMVVRMLALMSGCHHGVGLDDKEDNDLEWRKVVYIDLPQGQVSWHIAPHDLHLFEDFPDYHRRWDGNFNGNNPEFVKSVKQETADNEALKRYPDDGNGDDDDQNYGWNA